MPMDMRQIVAQVAEDRAEVEAFLDAVEKAEIVEGDFLYLLKEVLKNEAKNCTYRKPKCRKDNSF
jgi:hypothetical protein